jgi:A/G-specific adenine glycosylase
VKSIPVKAVKQKQRSRYFHYLVILVQKRSGTPYLFMNKRSGNDVWKNLYDFPLIETERPVAPERLAATPGWKEIFSGPVEILEISKIHKHVLSHQVIHARFILVRGEVPGNSATTRCRDWLKLT